MPALAITDLANLFGAVKFYSAARAAGVKPIIGADCWLQNPGRSRQAVRLLLLAHRAPGYLRLCDLLSRAWLAQPVPCARGALARPGSQEGTEGLIALSGAARGDVGQALLGRQRRRAPSALARGWARALPGPLLPRAAARRASRTARRIVQRARWRSPRGCALPVVATHPVQFLTPDDFEAHEARVCIAEGECSATSAGRSASPPSSTSRRQARDGASCSPTCRARSPTRSRSRKRCNLELELGKPQLPDFPTPDGQCRSTSTSATQAHDGLERRLRAAVSRRGEARRSGRAIASGSSSRSRPSARWASRATS